VGHRGALARELKARRVSRSGGELSHPQALGAGLPLHPRGIELAAENRGTGVAEVHVVESRPAVAQPRIRSYTSRMARPFGPVLFIIHELAVLAAASALVAHGAAVTSDPPEEEHSTAPTFAQATQSIATGVALLPFFNEPEPPRPRQVRPVRPESWEPAGPLVPAGDGLIRF